MHTRVTRAIGVIVLLATVSGLVPAVAESAGAKSASAPKTTWLCKPGQSPDPCTQNISSAVVPAVGAPTVVHVAQPSSPPVDCFYAYPTVSSQSTPNSNLTVGPEQTYIAADQAAPFSQVCRVFAPMYRQMTIHELFSKDAAGQKRALDIAYASLAQGFAAFLAQEPKGRHFVLLGHSQGAAMLIHLIAKVIDPNPALRARLVSALLLGGNLTVAKGKTVGGAFQHIPLCTSGHQLSCAVAYSSFYSAPPKTSYFGIPGQGVSLLWGQTSRSSNLQVACVNPASFGPGSVRLGVRFLNTDFPGAGYVTYPGLYRSQCMRVNGATFLHVTVEPSSAYPAAAHPNQRPTVASSGKNWGLHDYDVNLAAGDLVSLVARQEFYLHNHR